MPLMALKMWCHIRLCQLCTWSTHHPVISPLHEATLDCFLQGFWFTPGLLGALNDCYQVIGWCFWPDFSSKWLLWIPLNVFTCIQCWWAREKAILGSRVCWDVQRMHHHMLAGVTAAASLALKYHNGCCVLNVNDSKVKDFCDHRHVRIWVFQEVNGQWQISKRESHTSLWQSYPV